MGVVYSEPLVRRYRADCWSLATWFTVAMWLTRLLLPAYIAWQTQNLWVKERTELVQPYISFQNQLIVEAHNSGWTGAAAGVPVSAGAVPYTLLPIAWSSISAYQSLVGYSRGRQPSVRSSQTDLNHDQKPDRINITVTVPKRADVHSVSLVLMFDVELAGHVKLNMQSAVTLTAADAQSCSHVYFTGDLLFSQRAPIAIGTRRVIYDTPIVDPANITSVEDVLIPNIQAIAQSRNETVVVDRLQTHWVGGGQFADAFVAHVSLTVPQQRIHYTPALGEVLKFGWIQWLSLFVIVYCVTWVMQHWLFSEQIFDVASSDDVNPVGRPFINF